jgi:hypothetical protein
MLVGFTAMANCGSDIDQSVDQYDEWLEIFESKDELETKPYNYICPSIIETEHKFACMEDNFNFLYINVYLVDLKVKNTISYDVKYMTSIETLLKEGIFDEICVNDKTGCLFGTFMDVSNTIIDYIIIV